MITTADTDTVPTSQALTSAIPAGTYANAVTMMNEPMTILPRNWHRMTEKEKDEFINYGEQLRDRDIELARRNYKW